MFAVTSELARMGAGASGSRAAEPPDKAQLEVLRNLALINCDCDNVFDDTFVIEALKTMMACRQFDLSDVKADPPMCPAGYASGCQASMTGRVVYWASDFLRIGGCDEEGDVVGAVYQEFEICWRLKRATGSRQPGRGLALAKSLGLGVSNKVGATIKEDRGPVKIQNCHPDELKKMNGFVQFNDHNAKVMGDKMVRNRLVRNLAAPFGGGAPNVLAPLVDLQRACAALTGASWVATEAQLMPASLDR